MAKKTGLTKFDAVKQAMTELGPDAMPLAIKDFVKSRFGIEISADVASTYRNQLRKLAAPKAESGGVSLKDISTVKELLGRVGPDGLRNLVDLLAR